VLIVTNNAMAASAISRGVAAAGHLEVIGRIDSERPCTPEVAHQAPDVAVVDAKQPVAHVIDRIRELRDLLPHAKIILLAGHMDATWLAQAAAAGIDAAIRRTADAYHVGSLVRDIVAGNVFNAFADATPAAAAGESDPVLGLTGRETEILRLVAVGASNSAIAKDLWITEQTVKFHLSNVYRKLGVSNRTQASRYAFVNGLVDETVAPPAAPIAA
jgi:DNA-binding NarL/FixJ family response regulator